MDLEMSLDPGFLLLDEWTMKYFSAVLNQDKYSPVLKL